MPSIIEKLKKENIRKPGRYIDSEYSVCQRDFDASSLRFALVFPDMYEIGICYHGFYVLYNYILTHSDCFVDRAYAPDLDMLQLLERENEPLYGIASKKSLKLFDILGVTIQTELSASTIVKMLELSHVPVLAEERDDFDPLIMAGGAGAYNPEPYAMFFDAFMVGDGEELCIEIIEKIAASKELSRKDKLRLLHNIPGVYVPSLCVPEYDDQQKLSGFSSDLGAPVKVQKRVFDINQSPIPQWNMVPLIKTVHDRLIVEVMRGCLNGCRFCQAGFINRPMREKDESHILQELFQGLVQTGYNEVSFLSLSVADYPWLAPIVQKIMPQLTESCISLSLPSLRIDKFPVELASSISQVRKTGFTFAPEAGTDRLREVINKGFTEEQIIDTVSRVFDKGWQVLKLYFMLGLPTETDDDIQGIIDLIRQIHSIAMKKSKRIRINITLSPFNPKSHTPFQWAERADTQTVLERIHLIKHACHKLRNVAIKYHDLEMSLLESFFARADRRAGEVILQAVKNGAYLDTWDDHFKKSMWMELIEQFSAKYNYNIMQPYALDDPLPWDYVSCGIDKSFFQKELQKAIGQENTPNCRNKSEHCSGCGACSPSDHILAEPVDSYQFPSMGQMRTVPQRFRYWITFSKEYPASYIGHLDLIRNLDYIFRRANLPVSFTEGFHPKVKFSFYDALTLFWGSEAEVLECEMVEKLSPAAMLEALNSVSIAGVQFLKCIPVPNNVAKLSKHQLHSVYEMELNKELSGDLNQLECAQLDDVIDLKPLGNKCYQVTLVGKAKSFFKKLPEENEIVSVVKKSIFLPGKEGLVQL